MSKAIGEVRMKGEDEYNTMYSNPRQENTEWSTENEKEKDSLS